MLHFVFELSLPSSLNQRKILESIKKRKADMVALQSEYADFKVIEIYSLTNFWLKPTFKLSLLYLFL